MRVAHQSCSLTRLYFLGSPQEMKSRMDNSAVWREVDEEQCQAVLDGLERYIMQHIYDMCVRAAGWQPVVPWFLRPSRMPST